MAKQIVILHGWNSQISRWNQLKSELERSGFQVSLPVLPGFSGGQKLSKPWSLEDYTRWVEAYINKNKLEKPFLLGHSFGGQLACLVVLRDKTRLSGLILASAAAIRTKKTAKLIYLSALVKIVRKCFCLPPFCFLYKPARFLVYKLLGARDYYQASGLLKQTMATIIRQDLSDRLANIKLPTLILWGRDDQATPLKEGKSIHKLVKNSTLKIFPGRHGFLFDQPKKIVKTIKGWL
jgi:pimeloyl-ACP methyl ester carboxylesterase